MVAATSFVFLLLLLFSVLYVSAVAADHQPRSSSISLGSSLSPSYTNYSSSTSWLSSSRRFAFGFYLQGIDDFAIGIWFAQIPQHTVVWKLYPISLNFSSKATLLLTNDGKFILTRTQGVVVVFVESISWASMLDTGNFVVYDSSGEILWKSFDHPTNTLLPGQSLAANQELFSSVSETVHSTGIFWLKMQTDDNLVQYPIGTPDTYQYMYWISDTYSNTYVQGGDNMTLKLDDDGHLYLRNSTGFFYNITIGATVINRTAVVFYRMTIDVDGIFRLYSISLDNDQKSSNWSIVWESSTDRCDPLGICVLNWHCTLMDQQAKCNCIPGFNFTNENWPSLGCLQRKLNAEDCGKETQNSTFMSTLENIKWDEDHYSVISFQTEEECKESCLADGNCETASFTYNLQYCSKLKLPLRYERRRSHGSSATTFVKVTKSCSPTYSIRVVKESKGGPSIEGILIFSLTFTACLFMVSTFVGFLVYQYRDWAYKKISDQAGIGLVEEFLLRSFTYDQLEKVTKGFKEVLGKGGFSTIYKGTLSNDRRIVVVKRLDKVLDENEREFQTKMSVISKTHNRNLVQLLGYCCDGPNRLLVYDCMSNGSPVDFLFKSENPPCWHERVGIALKIARGIFYVHEECAKKIIHCGIKPQNILMDEYRCPRIADFGLSKLLRLDQTRTVTRIRGTRGYVAPEWHRNLPITVKVDVYSCGVMFLEIICCRRNVDVNLSEKEIILTAWVYNCFEAGELGKLVGEEEVEEITLERMVRDAIWCIQYEPSLHLSMKKVVSMLEGNVEVPLPPSSTSIF